MQSNKPAQLPMIERIERAGFWVVDHPVLYQRLQALQARASGPSLSNTSPST